MKQNLLTIVTTIEAEQTGAMKTRLKRYDPGLDSARGRAICPNLPFDEVSSLHFASFVVLEADVESEACLVFEATFDGSPEAFLSNLIEVAGPAIDDIYDLCKGYPAAGSEVPNLVRRYLLQHDVPANTAFAGSPGRTVAQVLEEKRLRERLIEYLDAFHKGDESPPVSYEGLLHDIQKNVVRTSRGAAGTDVDDAAATVNPNKLQQVGEWWASRFRWAEHADQSQFLVRYGRVALVLAVGAMVCLAALISVFILNAAIGPDGYGKTFYERVVDFFCTVEPATFPYVAPATDWFGPLMHSFILWLIEALAPLSKMALQLVILWLVLKLIHGWLRNKEPDVDKAPLFHRFSQKGTQLAASAIALLLLLIVITAWLSEKPHPDMWALMIIALIWFALRTSQLLLQQWLPDPRETGFYLRLLLHMLTVGRHLMFALIVGLGLIAIADDIKRGEESNADSLLGVSVLQQWANDQWTQSWSQDLWILHWPFVSRIATWFGQLDPNTQSGIIAVLVIIVALVIWRKLRHWKTSLKMKAELTHLHFRAETWRQARIDVVRFSEFLVLAFLLAFFLNGFGNAEGARPDGYLAQLMVYAGDFSRCVFIAGFYLLVTAAAVYVLGLIVLFFIRIAELLDRREYTDAAVLSEKPLAVFRNTAREEHGINTYQNHLVSLTHVKPGFFRLVLLKTTLAAVNLLAKAWYTRGDLGGIHTILYARWALLDGGRRLLFLTNYGGSWESYLNEFMDMAAVKGLNAIWTNTFVHRGRDRAAVSFPFTNFFLWNGAQQGNPFKSYVRTSQAETCVWYSAYPTVSITNVNKAARLRGNLFKQLSTSELDALFRDL